MWFGLLKLLLKSKIKTLVNQINILSWNSLCFLFSLFALHRWKSLFISSSIYLSFYLFLSSNFYLSFYGYLFYLNLYSYFYLVFSQFFYLHLSFFLFSIYLSFYLTFYLFFCLFFYSLAISNRMSKYPLYPRQNSY